MAPPVRLPSTAPTLLPLQLLHDAGLVQAAAAERGAGSSTSGSTPSRSAHACCLPGHALPACLHLRARRRVDSEAVADASGSLRLHPSPLYNLQAPLQAR